MMIEKNSALRFGRLIWLQDGDGFEVGEKRQGDC